MAWLMEALDAAYPYDDHRDSCLVGCQCSGCAPVNPAPAEDPAFDVEYLEAQVARRATWVKEPWATDEDREILARLECELAEARKAIAGKP